MWPSSSTWSKVVSISIDVFEGRTKLNIHQLISNCRLNVFVHRQPAEQFKLYWKAGQQKAWLCTVYYYRQEYRCCDIIQILEAVECVVVEYDHKVKSGIFHFSRGEAEWNEKSPRFYWVIIFCGNARMKRVQYLY